MGWEGTQVKPDIAAGPRRPFVRLPTGYLSQTLSTPEEHPAQAAEVEETYKQEQERETQPQTAAIPGGSGAAETLG
jgi:hypothetical protein